MRRSGLILAGILAVVAGCGGSTAATSGPQATTPPGGQAQATPTPPPAAVGADGTSVAHLEVTGGPQAGVYDASGPKVDCNISPTGSGATYIDTTKTEGLTAFTFSSGAAGASVTTFYFDAAFGAIDIHQVTIEISTLDPTTPDGTGTATLTDNGATIKWTINGTTQDGYGIKATIECGPVDRS